MKQGKLRIIAVASESKRLPDVDAPTFADLGVESEHLNNWRGVFAPPGLSAAQVASPYFVAQHGHKRCVATASCANTIGKTPG